MRHTHPLVALALLAACLAGTAARAADIPEPAPQHEAPAVDPLVVARAQIKAQQWDKVLAELQRVNLSRNADWHNLLGYVNRKKPSPDLVGAERHYDEALRLKPDHRGALEYSGELFLIKGDLSRAEQRLSTLKKACPSGCEELTDLMQDIARFKANGNKHTAPP